MAQNRAARNGLHTPFNEIGNTAIIIPIQRTGRVTI
jgi:hypothetical protein